MVKADKNFQLTFFFSLLLCGIDDVIIENLVKLVQGHSQLKTLEFADYDIRRAGCEWLVTERFRIARAKSVQSRRPSQTAKQEMLPMDSVRPMQHLIRQTHKKRLEYNTWPHQVF